jgi:hypothetical protein
MQTYFCRPAGIVGSTAKPSTAHSIVSGNSSDENDDDEWVEDIQLAIAGMDDVEGEEHKAKWIEDNQRRLGWLSDLFKAELKQVLGRRGQVDSRRMSINFESGRLPKDIVWDQKLEESLLLSAAAVRENDVVIPAAVDRQVLELVSMLAFSYEELPYHNMRHSCLVILSLHQMLGKIDKMLEPEFVVSPLTKIACLFSALIRNIRPRLQNQSWTECLSTEIAFEIFMDDRFDALRKALFATESDFNLFHGLVNNLLLATFSSTDEVLAKGCKERWEEAFENGELVANPRQQIVPALEQVILIAQHAHSMISWDSYVTWSMKLLEESQQQYHDGIIHFDPTNSWYQKALGYFDNFLIPLANRIDAAGILGSMGNEFVVHAVENRHNWESTGMDLLDSAQTGEDAVSKVVDRMAPRASMYLKD